MSLPKYRANLEVLTGAMAVLNASIEERLRRCQQTRPKTEKTKDGPRRGRGGPGWIWLPWLSGKMDFIYVANPITGQEGLSQPQPVKKDDED